MKIRGPIFRSGFEVFTIVSFMLYKVDMVSLCPKQRDTQHLVPELGERTLLNSEVREIIDVCEVVYTAALNLLGEHANFIWVIAQSPAWINLGNNDVEVVSRYVRRNRPCLDFACILINGGSVSECESGLIGSINYYATRFNKVHGVIEIGNVDLVSIAIGRERINDVESSRTANC